MNFTSSWPSLVYPEKPEKSRGNTNCTKMKKSENKSCENLYGGWDFIVKIFGFEILDHRGKRVGDKWHWWFE